MWRIYWLRKKWVTLRLTLRDGGERCAYCRCLFNGVKHRQRTIDHLVPLSQGGTWKVKNLVFACQKCNGKKSNLSFPVFYWSDWLKKRRESIQAELQRSNDNAILLEKSTA